MLFYDYLLIVKKRVLSPLLIIIICLIASGCAGGNSLKDVPDANGDIAWFFWGLWNGFTCLFALIGGIFSNEINMYEVHNCGFWYNLGFLLGALFFLGFLSSIDEDDGGEDDEKNPEPTPPGNKKRRKKKFKLAGRLFRKEPVNLHLN